MTILFNPLAHRHLYLGQWSKRKFCILLVSSDFHPSISIEFLRNVVYIGINGQQVHVFSCIYQKLQWQRVSRKREICACPIISGVWVPILSPGTHDLFFLNFQCFEYSFIYTPPKKKCRTKIGVSHANIAFGHK